LSIFDAMDLQNAKIIFYDGDCAFCNRSVAFVLKNDKTKSIQFASIQSEFTADLFIKMSWQKPDLSTFYFLENEQLFEKSTAAIRVSKYFSFPQSWLKVMLIIPEFIRDYAYDFIAKRRHSFSKRSLKETKNCVLLNTEDKKRFLCK